MSRMKTKIKEPVEEVLTEYQDPEEIARGGKIRTQRFRAPNGNFFMKIKAGPLVGVPAGTLIDLWDQNNIRELFYLKKIIPIEPGIPAMAEYVVISGGFRTVIEGEYRDIYPGQTLRLNQEEALELLRLRQVKPLDENIFHL